MVLGYAKDAIGAINRKRRLLYSILAILQTTNCQQYSPTLRQVYRLHNQFRIKKVHWLA